MTKDEFIALVASELGIDEDDVSVTVEGTKLVCVCKNVDEEDVFDEDFGLGDSDDEDDENSAALAPVSGK